MLLGALVGPAAWAAPVSPDGAAETPTQPAPPPADTAASDPTHGAPLSRDGLSGDGPPGDGPPSDSPARPTESDSRITLPQALATPLSYPPNAEGSAEVVLELAISATGHVLRARATTGAEPFAAAAARAAAGWRFDPARRGGVAVSAKVLFLVRFEQAAPEPPPTDVPAAAPGSRPISAAPTATPIEEIIVRGELPAPGARSLGRAEVRNLAGAFDDPLRSIEALPGVTPIATGLPLFFVRGAPPGNVGYFIDGIRIPLLYHAFLGPSVLHPALVEQVDLYGGPAPLRFGRYAGAVVDARLRRPAPESPEFPWRGEANARLIDAGAFVEAPLAGGRGYALVAGRYSYTALLLSLLSPRQRFEYWDYQGLVGYRLGRRDELSVFALGAYDYAGEEGEELGGTQYHRVDLRWDHEFSPRTHLRVAGTWGRDRTGSDFGFVKDDSLSARFAFEHRAPEVVLQAGGDVIRDAYDLDVDPGIQDPLTYQTLFPSRTDLALGAYASLTLWPAGPVTVTPGVRVDHFSSQGRQALSVDPRVTASYSLSESVRTTHGLGVAHQTPNFVPAVPGAQVGGLPGGLQRSLHWESAVEAQLPARIEGSLGVFINETRNLSDPIALSQTLDVDENSADRRAYGRAAGLEVYLKRPLTDRLGGLISYTYSRSLRSYDDVSTPPGYDRPHVFNAAFTYDLGGDLRLSTRFALASGVPGRRLEGSEFVFDGSRSRPFVRVDAKLAKRWHPSPFFFWGTYLEVLNATHGVQVVRRECLGSSCTDEGTGAITIPMVGIEAGWR